MIVNVDLKDRSYPIIIQRGLLDSLDEYLKGRIFVVTNTTVYKLYGQKLKKYATDFVVIPDGEKYKNLKTFEKIANKLLSFKIERKDTIVALGGGVVGDIAGFVASSVLRGVNFIQIPTTLLAQVDSSVGGKVAVNTKYGKNLLGAFYQPKMVLIDPNTLKTLPNKEIKSGLGEVVKYAYIEKNASLNFDENATLLEFLSSNSFDENVEHIIAKSVQIKANVVSKDEKESGLRQILNLGHTFAHPVEKISNFKITHGEAVAVGLMFAFELSYKLNLINEEDKKKALSLLEKFELGQKLGKKFSPNNMFELMKSDKKVQNAEINFVLPISTTEVTMKSDIDELLVKEILLSFHSQD